MADPITMPPVPYCGCAFCLKRRWELRLCAQIESELAEAAARDLRIKRERLDEPPPAEPMPVAYAARRPYRLRVASQISPMAARTFERSVWRQR